MKNWVKRHFKLLFVAFVIYCTSSWAVLIFPPRIRFDADVPDAAVSAVNEFCDEEDFLWTYPWDYPVARYVAELFTHRELRTKIIHVGLSRSGDVRAECYSTGLGIWFRYNGSSWVPDRLPIY
jgi:hypothetical protein